MNANRLPKGEWTRDMNLQKLEKSGLKFSLSEDGDTAIFRETGKPTAEFLLRRNRYRIRGNKKAIHGTVEQFLGWYRTWRGVS